MGTPRNQGDVREAFKRALRRAEVPTHFSPHCLRHTYASLLLIKGYSIYYVSRQLGHASIQITVDRYGRWLPATNPGAADDLERTIDGRDVTPDVTASSTGASESLNTKDSYSV